MSTIPALSPAQIARLLKSCIQGQREHYTRPLFLTGWPGVGKTDIVRQACAEAGAPLWTLRCIQHETVDGTGLPHVANGQAEWVPFSGFLPTDPNFNGVIFIDEVTQLDASWQKVLAGMLDREGVAGRRIPANSMFVLAGNRTQDRAGASKMLSIIQSRCKQIEMLFSLADWQAWANNRLPSPVHHIVRSFADFKGAAFVSFDPAIDVNPLPRTWDGVSDELYLHNGSLQDAEFEPILQCVVASLVGPGMAGEFMAFRQHWNMLHGVVDQIINTGQGSVPSEPSVIYALTGALSERIRGLNGKLTDTHLRNLVMFANRLSDSFSVLLARDILVASKTAERLLVIPEGVAWVKKHRPALLAARKQS